MTLKGKVALVTGSSRGIGKAIALELARQGADLVVTARSTEPGGSRPGTIHATAEEIRAAGRPAHAVRADLSLREDVERLAAESLEAFGRIDVLVNNAAYLGRSTFTTLWEISAESWARQLFVNLTAPFLLCRALAPVMKELGGGRIINVTSGAAQSGSSEQLGGRSPLVYGPSKAGLNRLTEVLAGDLREANISVVALDPGAVRSETYEMAAPGLGLTDDRAQPVEVPARAVGFLASCENPMCYSGKLVTAAEIAAEHGLLPA